MANDLQEVMEWVDGGLYEPATVRDANFQPKRLDTLRSRNSAAYKGINILIQRNGAKDFFWKNTIREFDETDWEECKLDIHHVFPQDWCAKNGIEPKQFNSILNKTPVSYKANRMIGGKAPSEYLRQLQTNKSVLLDDAGMDVCGLTPAGVERERRLTGLRWTGGPVAHGPFPDILADPLDVSRLPNQRERSGIRQNFARFAQTGRTAKV